MPKVLPAIFSYEDMKRRFAQDNPDDPYTRRKDLETGLYALDNWLIRVDDDNKAISTVGFKEHPSHTVVGGMYASAKGREIGGNNRALQDAREPQLNQSKPLVAAFGHRDGDNARWISTAKKNGWAFPDSENWEQMKQLLPESVVNEWNSAYPNGNWAIRSIRGEGEFAKCVYLDDPTPSWFNVLKYLPDNTWDDFELGEPAPDLGTRDRFKDKNIKSKGKAEYKAFVSQQYLRQVSDRIPNAGTTLMQGWLEKLTEMDLKKGKYWFFGTNVKQDNTYVMIDVIEKGQPYTANADKKLNLEGFETAIIFTGVSKEMVGKVKRGQGIPKGRKFLDIHGKYGVRGLRRGRRLPKEPKNIFPTFEKSWKDILKWKPDSSYEKFDSYLTYADGYKTEEPARGKNYASNVVLATGHYMDRGNKRYDDDKEEMDGWARLILPRIGETVRSGNWIYRSEDNNEMVMFDKIAPNKPLPQQQGKDKKKNTTGSELIVFTTAFGDDFKIDGDKWFDIWNEGEIRPETKLKIKRQRINVNLVDVESRLNRAKQELQNNGEFITNRNNLISRLKRKANMLPKKGKKELEKEIRTMEQGLTTARGIRKNLQEKVDELQQLLNEAKMREEE